MTFIEQLSKEMGLKLEMVEGAWILGTKMMKEELML